MPTEVYESLLSYEEQNSFLCTSFGAVRRNVQKSQRCIRKRRNITAFATSRSVQKALYHEVGPYPVPFYRRGHPWDAHSQGLGGRTAYCNSVDRIRPLDCGANIDRSTVLCPSRCVDNAHNMGHAEVGWDSDRLSCRNMGHGIGVEDSDHSTCARALQGGHSDRRNHGDGNHPHRRGGVLDHQHSYLDCCCSKALVR